MATGQDLINGGLRLIGQLAEGETPSSETSADALTAFNDMLESFNNERLLVPHLLQEQFTLVGSTASYTIGSGGDFDTTRPIRIDEASFVRVDTTDYPLTIINAAQYASIPVKTTTSTFPNVVYYLAAYPLATLYFYPVPGSAATLFLSSWKQLAAVTLSGTISLAPGYNRMLRYNLACELAPEFGVEPSPRVVKIAAQSKKLLKQTNAPNDVLSIPSGMVRGGRGGNIYSDIV
jgi:hypothetical protein